VPAAIRGAFGRIVARIREFTVAQRTIAIIGVAILVLGIVALTFWLTRPRMSLLYSGLSAQDASAVVEQLQGAGVPYEISGGGSSILVPEDQVYTQRLAAAAAGIPEGSDGGGYALLDDMGVTSSEFQQSVTYKRALEGEIASTIGAMDGVESVSVHLAIPERSVFVSETVPPTASVFVRTAHGVTLTPEQVQAILNLTSAAVEGLTPQNVAVIDQNGTTLSAVGDPTAGGVGAQAVEGEDKVRAAVQSILDNVVGVGNSAVAVNVVSSTESATRKEETFTQPEGGVIPLQENTSQQNSTGTGTGSAGVLGPDNIAVPDNTTGDGTYDATTTDRTNAVNKVTEERTIPAGQVSRKDVSVAVDSTIPLDVTPDEIQSLVSAAAGIDIARGDTVAVEFVPFSTAAADQAQAALDAADAAAAEERTWAWVRGGVIAAAVVAVAAIVIWIVARRRARSRVKDERIDTGLTPLFETRPEALLPAAPAELEGIAEEPLPPAVPHMIEPPTITIREQVSEWAAAEPERTADAIRALLDERVPA